MPVPQAYEAAFAEARQLKAEARRLRDSKIAKLLQEADLSNTEIARRVGCDSTVVRAIRRANGSQL